MSNVSMEKIMKRYQISDSFFVNTDEKWTKIKYDEIKFLRAFENGTVIFLTSERTIMANHKLSVIAKILSNHTNFVYINRSEIVNVDHIDGFKDNRYYIGKTPLYVTTNYETYLKEYFNDITIHD